MEGILNLILSEKKCLTITDVNQVVQSFNNIFANQKVEAVKIQTDHHNGVQIITFKTDLAVFDLYHILNPEQQNKTIYLEHQTREVVAVAGSAPPSTQVLINIGWDIDGKAYQAPRDVVKVPNYISPKIKDLSEMFAGCTDFNDDLSYWDTTNIWNMSEMFCGASQFDSDLASWDVANVNYMDRMFAQAMFFNQDIAMWDTSQVVDMSGMFHDAYNFAQDLSSWHVDSVEFYDHFADCADLQNEPTYLPHFKTIT
ncbi:BspA family leucine-rich repeat surface protein [Williamsoniiplasma lucivorax]|uniref:BspA family leucine-rich repeat surface protein n=1 Tax=Williamsoniiplasma lucivorax TaxID=209274 RepID=A0A2S5RAE7_9MOLU|nr:BspA family leucine-rich repeat surface protein [Williamsoniiplasma lucivorax]PPE04095.1 hypothetical protein ELUCI_v1c08750 [Williamsoniiplasma lucivorax]